MSRTIIAILRGLTPPEALPVTDALLDAGISRIEVPLNSPDAYDSIASMLAHAGDRATIGAGTVLDTASVSRLAEIGARMVVSPDCNPDVIRATKAAGMLSYPGVFTPSEAFSALRAGADGLKFFPAFKLGVDGFAALRAVLPPEVESYAVGGVDAGNLAEWKAAGIRGFGIGTGIYRPGDSAAVVADRARALVQAFDAVFS